MVKCQYANISRNKPKIYHKQPVGFHCRQIDRAERQKPKSKPLFGFRTEEKTILLLQYFLLHNPFYGLYPHNIVTGRQTSQIHHRFMTLSFLSDDTLAHHIEQLQGFNLEITLYHDLVMSRIGINAASTFQIRRLQNIGRRRRWHDNDRVEVQSGFMNSVIHRVIDKSLPHTHSFEPRTLRTLTTDYRILPQSIAYTESGIVHQIGKTYITIIHCGSARRILNVDVRLAHDKEISFTYGIVKEVKTLYHFLCILASLQDKPRLRLTKRRKKKLKRRKNFVERRFRKFFRRFIFLKRRSDDALIAFYLQRVAFCLCYSLLFQRSIVKEMPACRGLEC